MNRIEQIYKFCLKALLFTFPFGLQTLLYQSSFFSGQFSYFTAAFLHLSEIFLLLALITYACRFLLLGKEEANEKMILSNLEIGWWMVFVLIVLANFISVFWAVDRYLAIISSIKWLELLIVVWLISEAGLNRDEILKWLFWGAFLQALIGVGQYLKQGDLSLGFLGEPKLAANYLNVAKVDLAGEKVLRSYGTFAHPNLFGAYLLICLMLLFQKIQSTKFLANLHFLIAFVIGILLSFSRSVWLAVAFFAIFLIVEKAIKFSWKQLLLVGLLMIFGIAIFSLDSVILARVLDMSKTALDERIYFVQAALNILNGQYYGVGAGNFVLAMGSFSLINLTPWLFQPVHNFLLLAASETGIWTGILWLILFVISILIVRKATRRIIKSERFFWKTHLAIILMIFLLGMTDHYFYTLWPGQMIMIIYFGMLLYDYKQRRLELHQ